MNFTFSSSILFSALTLGLFGTQTELLKADIELNINVKNDTDINNFHYDIDYYPFDPTACLKKDTVSGSHDNISNGNSSNDKISISDPCHMRPVTMKIYVWDPVKKPDGDHVIDTTNGGFDIKITDDPQYFGISYCSENKYGICGGK